MTEDPATEGPATEDEVESQLRRVLDARAGSAPSTEGDRGDLDRRIARSGRRHRRALASVAAVVVVVGVAGGFAGGVAAERGRAPVGTAGPTAPKGGPDRFAAPPTAPEGRPNSRSGARQGTPSSTTAAGRAGGAALGAGQMPRFSTQCTPSSALPAPPARRLFVRTGRAGVTERVYRSPSPTEGAAGVVSIELSTRVAVWTGSFGLVPVPAGSEAGSDRIVGGTSGLFGVTEGSPVEWVAVQVGPSARSVQVIFPDGSKDAMAPIGGIAVLTHQLPTGGSSTPSACQVPVTGTVQVLDASGTVRSSEPVALLQG